MARTVSRGHSQLALQQEAEGGHLGLVDPASFFGYVIFGLISHFSVSFVTNYDV